MAGGTQYVPGTPIWTDLSTTDMEGAKSFYGALFGWEAEPVPNPEAGGYTMVSLGGKLVAGLGPVQTAGQPPAWLPYVATEDVDATMSAVKGSGGEPFFGPMDVFDTGRMGIFRDPGGAVLGLWQPRAMVGFELTDQPGSFTWFELNTPDVEAAKAFYGAVFGWVSKTSGEGREAYTEWKVGEKSIGGAMQIGQQTPPDVPPHWLVYFAVDDVDQAASKAQELGASALIPPMDFPGGRFSVLRDPQGAVVAVLKLAN